MIEARGLSKRYGSALAVDDLSFTVHPGLVTGFRTGSRATPCARTPAGSHSA